MAACAALSVFLAIKLLGFLLRGEAWFRGSHVSRREAPTLYWFIVGTLTFGVGATAGTVGQLAFMLYPRS
jgi:hypothetical protein